MNAEEKLAVLEEPFEYVRHDGSRISLAVAVLALIGDHSALNPLLALLCQHCRCCMWPNSVAPRSKAGAVDTLGKMLAVHRRRRGKTDAYRLQSETGQHIHTVSVYEQNTQH